MSGTTGTLQIVTTPASGWCDPETGVCHVEIPDEAAIEEAGSEDDDGGAPDATHRRAPPAG